MIALLSTSLGRLRVVGIAEGISFLALLGIAMPLKYMAGMPMAVRIVGSLHGALFVLYAMVLLIAWLDRGWSFGKAVALFFASVVPFGPFIAERSLAREAAEEQGASAEG